MINGKGGELLENRRVITKEESTRFYGNETNADDYKTRLLKYVPAETNTLYVTIMGGIHTAQEELSAETVAKIPFDIIIWLIFIGCFIFNLLYMWKVAKEANPIRLGISMGAFVVWAIALGDIFASITGWYDFMGTIILGFYTALAGLYMGK